MQIAQGKRVGAPANGWVGHTYRSVHNIRIERLWYDVTTKFGRKWKTIFQDLELRDGLCVEIAGHIWLLQHLFLPAINNDALEFAGAWNNHVVGIRQFNKRRQRGEVPQSRSPRDMFFFGMIEKGFRGVDMEDCDVADAEDELDEDDVAGYGVDWDGLEDQQIRSHHDEANVPEDITDDSLATNPFEHTRPDHLSHVEVEEANCPLSEEQLNFLQVQLEGQTFWQSSTPESYRLRWIIGLDICRKMFVASM